MRTMAIAFGLIALALTLLVHSASAEKSKMGCEIGKEVWNASIGKCEPGVSKWAKKAAAPRAKKPVPAKK